MTAGTITGGTTMSMTIRQYVDHAANSYVERSVQTSVEGGVATAARSVERGIHNPANVFTGMLHLPFIPEPHFTTSRVVTEASGPVAEAVGALEKLGAQHGIDGISMYGEHATSGLVRFVGSGGAFEGGGQVTKRIGAGTVEQLTEAAGKVIAALAHR
ncbi:MAG: hypothetical protein JWM98_1144 [Thermoleophilia bacterium]|nr:hypothetical protein [Thermoleophilia bacterium]